MWSPAEEVKEYDYHEEERMRKKTRTLVNRIIYTSALRIRAQHERLEEKSVGCRYRRRLLH
jgi:hypothetical protein